MTTHKAHLSKYSLFVDVVLGAHVYLSVFVSFLQLKTLSVENKQLHKQLEKEKSMRRQVEQLLLPPSTSQHCSPIHLPISLSAHPPPTSTSLSSFHRLPRPLRLDPATQDMDEF